MKRNFIRWTMSLLMAAIALAGLSCSNDKAGRSVGQEKAVKEYKKGVEKSKKIAVAKVNGSEITMAQLIGRVNLLAPNYLKGAREITPEMDQKMKREALDILIFRELAIQEAIAQGMKVPPDRIDAEIKELRVKMGSEQAFKERLDLGGETEASLRKLTERNMLFHLISDQEIIRKVRLDEKQVKDAYAQGKAKFVRPGILSVEDVFIARSKDDAAAMKKAQDLLSILRKNNDVSKLPFEGTFVVR
ncbi:MAG: SurA N-terminal domain-containing protein, partial [Thermodesulfovibrionales bacterium]